MQSWSTAINVSKRSLFIQWLFAPVNNSPLIIFRILFGFLLSYQAAASIFDGSLYTNFIQPPFTFTYIGFEFLQPLPGNGMYFYAGLMTILGLLIMTGAWYRISMIAYALLWTGLYLMQKSGYNNHYYLMLLLCWIMIFLPANRDFSIDVKRKAVTATSSCSRYCLWIFIAQLAIVYFFAATSKISADWFTGKYIAIQFSRLSSHRFIGILYSQKWFQLFICYGGFLFDLLVVPLLLWKRTRKYAFILSCLFHLFNSFTFRIGIFPYLSIALNIFFFDGDNLQRFFSRKQQLATEVMFKPVNGKGKKFVISILVIYLFFQLIIPMRSWFFSGNVFWTEEGYRLSWKMMLRTKSGSVHFKVVDPASNRTWNVEPAKIFAPSQYMWLSISPDIIWQYAQRLKKEFSKNGFPNVEIYAISSVSLNRADPRPIIDSTADLASAKWKPFKHSQWITKGP